MSHHRARKRFGQNFLIDDSIINRIAARFSKSAGKHEPEKDQPEQYKLVEIGPGRGALTQALLSHGHPLIALELDRDLIPILQTKFSRYSDFELHQGDALQTDFFDLCKGLPLRLVGNLPYNVATPLIFKLLDSIDNIVDMHFMLQWEVVARLCAGPGDSLYGQLSVVVQNLCDVRALFQVPPTAFSPAPKVESGFIALTPRSQPLITQELQPTFNKLVKTSFAHRRKTLRNNLKGILSVEQIEGSGINPGARAETLTLKDFAKLTDILKNHDLNVD